jgi:ring-1,2-phenylacetyl-CoA epoxidase subunit PaaD
MVTADLVTAQAVVSAVTDPELPMLTLADLGILRSVGEIAGRVVVTITPTYTACPAIETMRHDITHALEQAGYPGASVRTVLQPAWSSDWITAEGRRKLAEAGIAPPGAARSRAPGPVPLTLVPFAGVVACPLCGSPATELVSEFAATACRSLRRCTACREPFEHIKEI